MPSSRRQRPKRRDGATAEPDPAADNAERLEIRDAATLSPVVELSIPPGPTAWTKAERKALPVIDREAGLAVVDVGKGEAQVIALHDGAVVAHLRGHGDALATAALHGGRRFVATGASDGTVRIWRLGEMEPALTLAGDTSGIASLAFDRSGDRLVAIAQNGAARLWSTGEGAVVFDHSGGAAGAVRAKINPPGTRLLLEGRENARLIDAVSGAEIARIAVPRSDVLAFTREEEADPALIAFSPDGRWLYSPWTTRPPRLWRADTGRAFFGRLPEAEHDSVLEFDEEGRILVYRSPEGMVRVDLSGNGQAAVVANIDAGGRTAHSLSRRGGRLAVVGESGEIAVWDLFAQKKLVTAAGRAPPTSFLHGIRVWMSPGGQHLLVRGESSTAILYDAGSGQEIMRLADHRDGIKSAEFLDGGRWLITRDGKDRWLVWNVSEGRLVMVHRWPEQIVRHLVTVQTSAGSRGVAFIFLEAPELIDLATGRKIAEIGRKLDGEDDRAASLGREPQEEPDKITTVALLDGSLVAVGTSKGNLELWDTVTRTQVIRAAANEPGAVRLIEPVRQDRFVTVTAVGVATLWHADAKAPLRVLEHEHNSVRSVLVNADATRILLRHDDGDRVSSRDAEAEPMTLWDTETGNHVSTLEEHRKMLSAVAFSPDDRWLATGGDDGRVHIWDAASGEPAKEAIARHRRGVAALAWSPDSKSILSIAEDEEAQSSSPDADMASVQLRDIATGEAPISFTIVGTQITAAAFSADGRMIVTGAINGRVSVIDRGTGRLLLERRSHARVGQVAFIAGDEQFVAVCADGRLFRWRAPTTDWRQLREHATNRPKPAGGSRELN
jgi:WD40 repeat protein